MKKPRSIILIVMTLAMFLAGCGSNLYVNKDYHFEYEDNFTLAIIPLYGDTSGFTDSLFTSAFTYDAPRNQELFEPAEIRWRLSVNEQLEDVVKKIILGDHSKTEKKRSPGMMSFINEQEFIILKEGLDSSDVVLIPIELSVGNILGHTTGNIRIRLYDLHSAKLIFEKSENLNVNLAGDEGARYLTMVLIGIAAGGYEKHFIDTHVY